MKAKSMAVNTVEVMASHLSWDVFLRQVHTHPVTTPTRSMARMAHSPPSHFFSESAAFVLSMGLFSAAMVDVVSVMVGQEQPVDAAGVDAACVVADGVVAATVGHVVSHTERICPGSKILGHVELSLPACNKVDMSTSHCRIGIVHISCGRSVPYVLDMHTMLFIGFRYN